MQSLPRSKSPTPAGPDYRGGKSRAVAKDVTSTMDYGYGWDAGVLDDDWFGKSLYHSYGGIKNMRKADFEKLAEAVLDIKKQLVSMALDSSMGRPDAAAIGEMVAARLGLVLANGNDKFDSFRWAAACKGEKYE